MNNMATYPSKTTIPTAISARSNQNLDCTHITTSNFMELGVGNILHLVPGQSVNVNQRMFTRLEPMPVPTFGTAYLHARWYFVPFRTVMPQWNDFITDTPHVAIDSTNAAPFHVSSTPYIANSVLVNLFQSEGYSTPVESANIDNADIVTLNVSGSPTGRNLTYKGRVALKILTSLGYSINFNMRGYANSAPNNNYCALPLLCLAKIYLDWYYPSVYVTDEKASAVSKILKADSTSPLQVDFTMLNYIFDIITSVCYDSDYFTSSWDNPVSPSEGTYSSVIMKDITNEFAATIENESGNGTPYIDVSSGTLTKYGQTALNALTDYLKRHQISSSRVLDRYLARFGKVLDSAVLDRSIYLGSNTNTIDFGNVTATADTEGAQLGSYSGIGVGNLNGGITFSSDEYGVLICVTSIVPRANCYQGCDRHTLHLTKLDFWTPEFDNLGVQALATRELFVPLDSRQQYPNATFDTSLNVDYGNLVFGFVPRYAEYKRGRDVVSGDYRLKSKNTTKNAWDLNRDVLPYFSEAGITNTKHSVDFLLGLDAEQYDRIFYYGREFGDTFNVIHLFNIESSFPGKKLFDTYEFENEDDAQKVSIDVNGVKAN